MSTHISVGKVKIYNQFYPKAGYPPQHVIDNLYGRIRCSLSQPALEAYFRKVQKALEDNVTIEQLEAAAKDVKEVDLIEPP